MKFQTIYGCRNEIAVFLCFFASACLVSPWGNYPFVDDWAYLRSLHTLHYQGELRILDWNPMSLIGHLWWTRLFTSVAGFHFDVARFSVILLASIGGVFFYRTLVEARLSPARCWLGTLTLLFCPLHLLYMPTYMTDVPALAWQILSVWALKRGIDKESKGWLTLGSFFSGYCFLIRQSGLIPAGVAAFYLFLRSPPKLSHSLYAALPCGLIFLGFQVWYWNFHGPTLMYQQLGGEVLESLIYLESPFEMGQMISLQTLYLGLFTFPLVFAWKRIQPRPFSISKSLLFALLGLFGYLCYLYISDYEKIFPWVRNTITPFGFFGIGEFTPGYRPQLWNESVGIAISILGVLATMTFFWRGLQKESSNDQGDSFFSLLLTAQVLYCLVTSRILFDRHLLLLLPTSIAWFLARTASRTDFSPILASLILAPLGLFSVLATHDVLEFERQVHYAGEELIEQGIPPWEIIGGYPFDGWHTYHLRQDELTQQPMTPWYKADPWHDVRVREWKGASGIIHPAQHWWITVIRPYAQYNYLVCVMTPDRIPLTLSLFKVRDRVRCNNWWPGAEFEILTLERAVLREISSEPQQ